MSKTCLFFAGVFSILRAVPQKEGYLGLYKGNGAMMVRIFPYGAIQFMAFDNYKKVHKNISNERILRETRLAFVVLLCLVFANMTTTV